MCVPDVRFGRANQFSQLRTNPTTTQLSISLKVATRRIHQLAIYGRFYQSIIHSETSHTVHKACLMENKSLIRCNPNNGHGMTNGYSANGTAPPPPVPSSIPPQSATLRLQRSVAAAALARLHSSALPANRGGGSSSSSTTLSSLLSHSDSFDFSRMSSVNQWLAASPTTDACRFASTPTPHGVLHPVSTMSSMMGHSPVSIELVSRSLSLSPVMLPCPLKLLILPSSDF